MAKLKRDIIEMYYFKKEEDTKSKQKAVGYRKVIDGILKEEWGYETPWAVTDSFTEVEYT